MALLAEEHLVLEEHDRIIIADGRDFFLEHG
jgi:hypothetical protein